MSVAKAIKILVGLVIPAILAAQDFRNETPAMGSPRVQGWRVDPSRGALSVSIPMGVVPGAIPIPVALTMNGSHTNYSQGYNDSACNFKDYGVYGTVGFGFIGFSSATGTFFLLEEGQKLSPHDFSIPVGGSFGISLRSAYGIPGTDANTRISNDGQYLWVTCTAAEMSADLASLLPAPVGYPAAPTHDYYSALLQMTGSNYHIIADKNRLRIYKEVATSHGYIAVPLLWKDRFNHWVKFTWEHSSLPSTTGMESIEKVSAVNEKNLGVVVRWANYLDGSTGDQDLLRADFTGFCGPSMFVKGVPGSGNYPTNIPLYESPCASKWLILIGGMVSLPKDITIASFSETPQPSWNNYAGAGAAAGPSATGSLTANYPQKWSLGYGQVSDVSGQGCYSVISSIKNPSGIETGFTYQSTVIAPSLNPALTAEENRLQQLKTVIFSSVCFASEVDHSQPSSAVHNSSWNITVPSSDGVTWIEPRWTDQVKDGFGALGSVPSDRVETFTYVSPRDMPLDYGNGFLTSRTLSGSDGTLWSSWTCHSTTKPVGSNYLDNPSKGGGLDYSMSMPKDTTVFRLGEASTTETKTYSDDKALQVSDITRTVDCSGTKKKFLSQHFTYNPMWSMLEGQQVTSIQTTRWALSPTTVTKVWDTGNQLKLQETFLNASDTLQHGTTYAYDADSGKLTSQGIWHKENSASQSASPATVSLYYDPKFGQVNSSVTSYADYTSTGVATRSTVGRSSSSPDDGGRPTIVTGEDQVATTYAYDLYGRPTSISRPNVTPVTIEYPDPWTIRKTQGSIQTTTHLDGFGRTIKQDMPDGSVVTFEYDQHGRLRTTTKVPNDGSSPVKSATTITPVHR